MMKLVAQESLLVALATVLVVAQQSVVVVAQGQISSPCTASMVSSFTPCMNFITNSTANGTAPTADCCNALKSLTSGSRDCACLLVTGNVPFQLPINRTLSISLPRACNTPGVPLQCKAAGAPLGAPGPSSSLSPTSSPSLSPSASAIPTTTSPAASPATDDSPTSPAVTADSPAATTETRPNVTPSSGNPSHRLSSPLFFFGLALVASFKCY